MNKILQVNPIIEEFMNYGMTYIVWYRVPAMGGVGMTPNAYMTKNRTEAIEKQKELQKIAVFADWELL